VERASTWADVGDCVHCRRKCVKYGPHGNPACPDCGGPARPMPETRPAPGPRIGTDILAAGLAYARHGWRVFVLSSGKVPVKNCKPCHDAPPDHGSETCPCLTCHGFYAATTDPDRVRAMVKAHPRGLLAIRTGRVSGLVVVDVDPRSGGVETHNALQDAGFLPGTLSADTASGGWHLYYAHPGGQSRIKELGPGVDVKADGGYVLAPPSRSSTGGRYAWFGDGRYDHAPAALHPAVMAKVFPPIEPPTVVGATASAAALRMVTAVRFDNTGGGFTPASGVDPGSRLSGLLAVVLAAHSGERNNRLNWAAHRGAELVVSGALPLDAVRESLAEAAAAIGLGASESLATIRSGLRSGGVPA